MPNPGIQPLEIKVRAGTVSGFDITRSTRRLQYFSLPNTSGGSKDRFAVGFVKSLLLDTKIQRAIRCLVINGGSFVTVRRRRANWQRAERNNRAEQWSTTFPSS